MNEGIAWWQDNNPFLDEALPFINAARACDDPIVRCDNLSKALNKTWNAFYQVQRLKGQLNETEIERSDAKAFRALLLRGINTEQSEMLCQSDGVRILAELTPRVMDHNVLLKEQYDPFNIADSIRKRASAEHKELANAFARYRKEPQNPDLREALLKKLTQLIYIVRSNIMHSEKTPNGPDLKKAERDKVVTEAASCVMDEIFNILFDYPSKKLAVYGTLAPSATNADALASLKGEWHEGVACGEVKIRDGFREFFWVRGCEVPVRIFVSDELPSTFARLDRFEGPRYQRIVIPVTFVHQVIVANIYQGVQS